MQISQKLRQFTRNKALLITSSQHTSKLYIANKGEINLIKELKVEKPEYSDKKEDPITSPEKNIKKIMKQDFAKAFKKLMSEFKNENFDEVYLFCPQELTNETKSLLPKKIAVKIIKIIKGNFNKKHPLELIK